MKNISVLDLNYGNVNSVKKMINKVGYSCEITNNPEIINSSDILIIPGVGTFDNLIIKLNNSGLSKLIKTYSLMKDKKIIGICLGMQILLESSEEGKEVGLGLIKGSVKHLSNLFDSGEAQKNTIRYPNIGWRDNTLTQKDFKSRSWKFYHVHNYYCKLKNESDTLFQSEFHGKKYCSGFRDKNIIGLQFHPEKSHKYGMELFKHLLEI